MGSCNFQVTYYLLLYILLNNSIFSHGGVYILLYKVFLATNNILGNRYQF